MLSIPQDIVEHEDGREVVSPPVQQLSAEKLTRYGIFLMDYGRVCCGQVVASSVGLVLPRLLQMCWIHTSGLTVQSNSLKALGEVIMSLPPVGVHLCACDKSLW